jgi:hypothetical protein
MNRRLLLTLAILPTALMGCASSKVSSSVPNGTHSSAQSVRAIAMAPGGGLLSEAVAIELSNRGFNVIDSPSTTKLLVRLDMSELELSKPEGLAKLQAQGIDAYLSVKGLGAQDGRPISCSARLNSTSTGKVIVGVTWQNGWGGGAGSIADRTMRKGLTEAATEIAAELAKSIAPS